MNMRRFTMTMALVATMVVPVFAERVTPETARMVATTFLNNNGAKTTQLTDLSKIAGFENLYIFTTESSFVVMSADDYVKPILGYSLTGKFETNDMPENVSSWLQGYNDGIQFIIGSGIKATAKDVQVWNDLSNGKDGVAQAIPIVDALVQTRWNQGSPYNNLCPKKNNISTVTGCVATAMAQIMKFWEHPTTGMDSHSYTWDGQTLSVDFSATPYDWGNMKNSYSSSYTSIEATAVATLMYHCGVSVEMKYNTSGNGGSSASTSRVMSALATYFGYAPCMEYKSKDNYGDEIWITMLKRELDDGRPLQYRGSDAGGNGGHSFVCDGYDSDDNFHFNWGWGGRYDGFYSINDMEPGTGGIGAGNGVYTVGESAIFGIEPISPLTAPILSASVSQNVITLAWNTVEDAISYDIYRDNLKIATNITDNSYVDSDVVSGTYYEYYVRAVSGETRSNPSNLVTKLAFFPDYTPSALTATLTSSNAILTWTKPQNHATLQYATDYSGYRYGMGQGKDTYWMEVFAPSRLNDFIGMYIEKVSAYLEISGNYTLFIYQAEPNTDDDESIELYETTFLVSSAGWIDIELESPIQLDCNKELWIMMYYPYTAGSPQSSWYPATYGAYDEIQYDNMEDEERYNPRLIGELVDDSMIWFHVGKNISWLFRAYISDGTYTYNIYDGEMKLNEEAISDTTYIHENPATNTIHNYTVKTNYYGGESATSNTASLVLGANTLPSLTLENNDNMTIGNGSTLTVTGDLSNVDAANLILENGAQLIHNSISVAATVKKNIAAWTTGTPVGGWYFIASPINSNELAPSSVVNMITDTNEENGPRTYDLYSYDVNAQKPWVNYRKHTNDGFVMANGASYLYANAAAQTLEFSGEIKPYNTSTNTVTLANTGWNLIGNPFTCQVTVDCAFAELNNESSVTYKEAGSTINPCAGIAVYGTANETVTFSMVEPQSPTPSPNSLNLFLTQQVLSRDGTSASPTNIDNTIVNFDEGNRLGKFHFGEKKANLYIPVDGKEYAIVSSDRQSEIPVNFKVHKNGIYTLNIETNDTDLDYLHLIDNLTGNDVDLLTTPDYTFEAKTSDYASRFRLVFSDPCEDTNDDDAAPFAYVSNGNIVITGVDGDAGSVSLQIVDMLGHVITSQGDVSGNISTANIPAGVYVLHLSNAQTTRTQKIVVQ